MDAMINRLDYLHAHKKKTNRWPSKVEEAGSDGTKWVSFDDGSSAAFSATLGVVV